MLKKTRKIKCITAHPFSFFITGLINILIAYFDISGLSNVRSEQTDIFFPSSKVIGTVWMLLIAGLSYSFSVVAKKDEIYCETPHPFIPHLCHLPFLYNGFFITQQYDLRKLSYNFLWEFYCRASIYDI